MSVDREFILPKRLLISWEGRSKKEESISHYWIRPVLVLSDLLSLLSLSVLSNVIYRWLHDDPIRVDPLYFGLGCTVAALTVTLLESRRLYRRSFVLSTNAAFKVFKIWLAVFAVLALSAFLLGIGQEFSRGTLLIFFIFGLADLITIRWLARRLLAKAIEGRALRERRVFLIGDSDEVSVDELKPVLRRHGYVVASVFFFESKQNTSDFDARISSNEFANLIRSGGIDEIMLAVGWSDATRIQRIVDRLRILPVSIRLLPDRTIAKLIQRPMIDIGLTKAIELKRAAHRPFEQIVKRTFDIFLAVGFILGFLPMLLVIGALIKFDSPGPIFFSQTRVGFNGRKFRIYKFRTMKALEDGPRIRQATKGDDRVTRLGRWLRSSSLDELPQLVNVLLGDMSIVGPRPHAVAHNNQYDSAIANYAMRHHVKPGITGWAQVCGFRGETPTLDVMLKRVEHDLWYIDNWSFWLDLMIIAWTTVALMRPRNAY